MFTSIIFVAHISWKWCEMSILELTKTIQNTTGIESSYKPSDWKYYIPKNPEPSLEEDWGFQSHP